MGAERQVHRPNFYIIITFPFPKGNGECDVERLPNVAMATNQHMHPACGIHYRQFTKSRRDRDKCNNIITIY